jgi:hypothetical protein
VAEYEVIDFTDEPLADGIVHRRYSDGREEWRSRGDGHVVWWRDDQGKSGTDEALGEHIVKRQYASGRVVYGREQGYGRTAWADGTVTRNRTAFAGRMGTILAAGSAGGLFGTVRPPPQVLPAEDEEELRRQARRDGGTMSAGIGGQWSGGWGDSDDSDG